jgi:hypothetical protein
MLTLVHTFARTTCSEGRSGDRVLAAVRRRDVHQLERSQRDGFHGTIVDAVQHKVWLNHAAVPVVDTVR